MSFEIIVDNTFWFIQMKDEVKVYTFDEICESQDFEHEEDFILGFDHDRIVADKDAQIAVLEARFKKCKEQRDEINNAYSPYSKVEIIHMNDELDLITAESLKRVETK